MTTYAIRTEGAALNFYNAIMALAQTATVFNDYVDGRKVNPSVDAELIRVKHNTQYFSIRFSRGRLIDFAASILKNWEAFGGGAKPAREKKARSAWPARALSVLKSCFEDGDLSAVRRIALDELGGFVAGREIVDAEGVARSITTILVSPEPVEGWEDVGIVVAYNIAAKQWAVMHQASGIGCGGSARTKKAALDAFNATIERVGEAFARDKMSAAGSNPYTAADWDAEHLHLSPAVDATVAQAAAEDAQSVAAPEVQSAPAAAVESLYNPGTPDPKNSAALPELGGFRPGDVVDVHDSTIGRSTIELVFLRKLAGFDAQPMARIVGASGKRLDMQLFQLTRVEAPEPEAAQDTAPAAQDVAESKAAAPVEIEAAEGAAAPAGPEQAAAEDYTITIKPLSTRGKPYAIVRCPSSDGYKTRAARLASSIARDRYSHRQDGYVMSTAAAARFEALYAEGADACTITGNVYNPSAVNDVIEQASSVTESGAPVADTTCSGIAPASPEYVALRSAAREARRAALAAIDTARVSSAQAFRELTADDSDYSYLIPSDGAAAPAEPAPMTAPEPANAPASPEFVMIKSQCKKLKEQVQRSHQITPAISPSLFSDPRTGSPVVVPNNATADAMARSRQLSGKVAVRKATPEEMADERNAFTGYNAGEGRRIGYVLEMLQPQRKERSGH